MNQNRIDERNEIARHYVIKLEINRHTKELIFVLGFVWMIITLIPFVGAALKTHRHVENMNKSLTLLAKKTGELKGEINEFETAIKQGGVVFSGEKK